MVYCRPFCVLNLLFIIILQIVYHSIITFILNYLYLLELSTDFRQIRRRESSRLVLYYQYKGEAGNPSIPPTTHDNQRGNTCRSA